MITICRQNPGQLEITLEAMAEGARGLSLAWELLVLDGSDDSSCARVADRLALKLGLPLRYVQRPAKGIYAAMNEALGLASGDLLSFMNAGDRYLPGGLTALVKHWLKHSGGVQPLTAVFGQALVQPTGRSAWVQPWLTPPAEVRDLRLWLRLMVPCHQAFIFETRFARSHPYKRRSLVADRSVMRAALGAAPERAYLAEPVCVYDLSGASSALPRWRDLPERWADGSRSWLGWLTELIKAAMGVNFVSCYPLIMKWRSMIWALICCKSVVYKN